MTQIETLTMKGGLQPMPDPLIHEYSLPYPVICPACLSPCDVGRTANPDLGPEEGFRRPVMCEMCGTLFVMTERGTRLATDEDYQNFTRQERRLLRRGQRIYRAWLRRHYGRASSIA